MIYDDPSIELSAISEIFHIKLSWIAHFLLEITTPHYSYHV